MEINKGSSKIRLNDEMLDQVTGGQQGYQYGTATGECPHCGNMGPHSAKLCVEQDGNTITFGEAIIKCGNCGKEF